MPEGGRNAVTWGVFPGQEIAQTTIIEKESFLSWKVSAEHARAELAGILTSVQDEAFSIWSEWASFYPPGSQERSLLEGISNDRWLVSLIHHDFLDPSALWTFLYKGNKPLL